MTRKMISRHPSREVTVGEIPLGSGHPVRVQSMTRTDTRDVKNTFLQCVRAFEYGAEYMRISIPGREALPALRSIMQKLSRAGYHRQGIIADIHFSPELACEAARIAHKVRINPGNYEPTAPSSAFLKYGTADAGKKTMHDPDKRTEELATLLQPLTDVCREYGTALRIGVNAASLPRHVVQHMGRTPEALVETAIEYGRTLAGLNFQNAVLSLKSSTPGTTFKANQLLAVRLAGEGLLYPLHIGVTEAGWGVSGRIRSALGIIPLLQAGIGDTVRVSLTESPEHEIRFARSLLESLVVADSKKEVPHESTPPVCRLYSGAGSKDEVIADVVRQFLGAPSHTACKELSLDVPAIIDPEAQKEITAALATYAGLEKGDTTFISCPACARVQMNMERLCAQVKERLSDIPGCTVAIMGCMVNGPGEMAEADYGIIASGKGRVTLYQGQTIVKKNILPATAIGIIEKIAQRHTKSG